KGCNRNFNSSIAVSVTGIAGPDGGSDVKPVGLVYIAFMIKDKIFVKENRFGGDRDAIRERTFKMAFDTLIKELREI
ncbi:MAG: CinA family protein, partial [Deferribacterales bacterium]